MQSVTLGVGQFCTNPGLVIGLQNDHFTTFVRRAEEIAQGSAAGTMLTPAICERFHAGVDLAKKIPGVRASTVSKTEASGARAGAVVFSTEAETFLQRHELREEIFGPATVVVGCHSTMELEAIARSMSGQLTATIHGTEEDLAAHRHLVTLLQEKVGRLLFNGFPTGVEVCPSMHHGGPYPATTDSRSTSVGTAAIKRFARPICFQNFPSAALPPELQNKNARQIWRLIDGKLSKEDC
jgi:NADP-dependent aldehyde dehydrogenase